MGYILYTPDGYMSVAIMGPDRAKFAPPGIFSAAGQGRKRTLPAPTCPTADNTSFRGETVIHHVDLSLFTNWVGIEQERLVEVTGNRMTLSTRRILLGGTQWTADVIWERV